jgi:hypothetical protein
VRQPGSAAIPFAGALLPEARGDLETIVHMALEKDRDRRYQTASGLAADLRRYLVGDAISARPPSTAYRLRVFARRNRGVLAAAAGIFVILVGAAGVSTFLYLKAERERVRAQQESARSRAAYEFITGALASIEPESYDHQPTLLDLVDRMSEKVGGSFPGSPGTEADIRRSIAWGYLHQERWKSMEFQLTKALELRRQESGDADPKTMELLGDLSVVYEVTGDVDRKVEVLQEWYQASVKAYGERDDSLYDTSLRILGEGHRITRLARSQLAASLLVQDKISDAKKLYGNRAVPADLGIEKSYQGAVVVRRLGAELLVFWETWCPFSQRTVPKLEQVHVRNPSVQVFGLTATRPPATDEAVRDFASQKHLTFPIAKTSLNPWNYFGVPGTPWIVLAVDGEVVWESAMKTPDQLLEGLVERLPTKSAG